MSTPILYYQYNPEFKETSYSINYVHPSKLIKSIPISNEIDQDSSISYYSKYTNKELINQKPCLFIIFLDESQYADKKLFKLEKQALSLFIKSLPPKSYFQLIRCGDYFHGSFFKEPVENTKENIDKIFNKINEIEEGSGNYSIDDFLYTIFYEENESYEKIKLEKHIILFNISPAYTHKRKNIYDEIKKNSNKFRIHSLGIGNNFDKYFIEKIGKLSNGSSYFIDNEKDYEKIDNFVIEALNKCLWPYLIDLKFINKEKKIIDCYNNFIYKDEIINYSFILDEKNKIDIDNLKENIIIEIEAKDPKNEIKEKISISRENITKLENGDNLLKIIIQALDNSQIEQKEIDYIEKYQIISKNRAIFAEISKPNSQSKVTKATLIDHSNWTGTLDRGCAAAEDRGQSKK